MKNTIYEKSLKAFINCGVEYISKNVKNKTQQDELTNKIKNCVARRQHYTGNEIKLSARKINGKVDIDTISIHVDLNTLVKVVEKGKSFDKMYEWVVNNYFTWKNKIAA